ncbi:hypothetical protein C5470_12850 [Photorhabdus stackebrandtii]|uniref:Uncharacterized protein n=1 Tax=Photorhabdus stackebrandtii TaxID=1123042 RepID=A0A7X5QN56_9GAMM|nr:hypothetical protein [Photorhabdus stackebrandtii]
MSNEDTLQNKVSQFSFFTGNTDSFFYFHRRVYGDYIRHWQDIKELNIAFIKLDKGDRLNK